MLTKIREKAQGAFAWGILILIGVPFALWGINNYLDINKEPPVASVGDKAFYQRDVNKAYEQYRQNLQGAVIDESMVKAQALDKLIKDEVLLQYVRNEGLAIADSTAREFIKSLPYFQADGKFSEKQYRNLLNSQRMSSAEFVSRIRNALVMEQLKGSVINTAFATDYDVQRFFKIQNQQRDVEYVTIGVKKLPVLPTSDAINAYYQQHQDLYMTPEQVSVEYVELALEDIAKTISAPDDKLKAFYEEQKDQYTTPERRKISHILFAINNKVDDKAALEKALKAKQELAGKDFAALAAQISDDKLTAKNGGDLGLFNVGTMEKSFEEAAAKLKLNEVSDPVRSAFGYHLIKVTELTPGTVKTFDEAKADVEKAYRKNQAESLFYEQGEKLTELSYENPDSLQPVADMLKLPIKKSAFFTKEKGDGIAADEKIRKAAFSEEVLKGDNSAPVELGTDRLVVLRVQEHKQAARLSLEEVKPKIAEVLAADEAKRQNLAAANDIKAKLQAGERLQKLAADRQLELKTVAGLKRTDQGKVSDELSNAIFKAAKPAGGKPTVFITAHPDGSQTVVNLNKTTEGVMSDEDKKQMGLAVKNLGRAYGQAEFDGLLATLEKKADISIRTK
jgi:peptidyl-prolyl cis-trans isomerase D